MIGSSRIQSKVIYQGVDERYQAKSASVPSQLYSPDCCAICLRRYMSVSMARGEMVCNKLVPLKSPEHCYVDLAEPSEYKADCSLTLPRSSLLAPVFQVAGRYSSLSQKSVAGDMAIQNN